MAASCLPAEGSDNGPRSCLPVSQVIASCSWPIKERTWLHSALPPRPLLASPPPRSSNRVRVVSKSTGVLHLFSTRGRMYSLALLSCYAVFCVCSHGTFRPPQGDHGVSSGCEEPVAHLIEDEKSHFAWNLPCLCCRGSSLLRHGG